MGLVCTYCPIIYSIKKQNPDVGISYIRILFFLFFLVEIKKRKRISAG